MAPPPKNKRMVEGVISIDDPYLMQHFREEGKIMEILRHKKRPGTIVVYGFTLHAYCFIQGLLCRGIAPQRIKLVKNEWELDSVEEQIMNNTPAFQGDPEVQKIIDAELESQGVQIFQGKLKKDIGFEIKKTKTLLE